jgi:hypothetical protein
MFNKRTHNKPQAWHPLGYIPNLGLQCKAESAHGLKKEEKIKLYHDILRKILAPLGQLQKDGGLPFCLHYGGVDYNVILKLRLNEFVFLDKKTNKQRRQRCSRVFLNSSTG